MKDFPTMSVGTLRIKQESPTTVKLEGNGALWMSIEELGYLTVMVDLIRSWAR